jgi:hypothetical protein
MSETISKYESARAAADEAKAALELRLAELLTEAGESRALLGRRRPKAANGPKVKRTRKAKTVETTEAA